MRVKSQGQLIGVRRSSFLFYWEELLYYRDLLYFLFRRDLIANYRQTILGPLWFFLQPLLVTGIFVVVFSKGLGISTNGTPPFLFYLCGLVSWRFFSQTLLKIAYSFTSNSKLFGKIYFPRLMVPLSIIQLNLVTYFFQFGIFILAYSYFKFFTPVGQNVHSSNLLLLPLAFLQLVITSLAFGLCIAALTAKYRDLQYALDFLIQLWLYTTPIIYPASAMKGIWFYLIQLNPMTGVVESFRHIFFENNIINPSFLLTSWSFSLLFLFLGLFLFGKVEGDFVDTL